MRKASMKILEAMVFGHKVWDERINIPGTTRTKSKYGTRTFTKAYSELKAEVLDPEHILVQDERVTYKDENDVTRLDHIQHFIVNREDRNWLRDKYFFVTVNK